ncbi:hypothetical protein KDH_49920 [Dictyobacter sp. S3.2.2.5]|uniref:Uncharacterized protein n=1 Tax=Dictyobacter halimunensis TaxID=3026934 RepID=A0ABQ6FX34_9CHLR|nr:hypothetical protein KDH_49920 [Dictyobacter sp. S3.2.2.5]
MLAPEHRYVFHYIIHEGALSWGEEKSDARSEPMGGGAGHIAWGAGPGGPGTPCYGLSEEGLGGLLDLREPEGEDDSGDEGAKGGDADGDPGPAF